MADHDFNVRQAKPGLSSRVKVSVTYLLVQRLVNRRLEWATARVAASEGNRVSRSESEPISAPLSYLIDDQPALNGEVWYLRGSNEHMHAQGDPGWDGTARAEGKIEEPGRPDGTTCVSCSQRP